MKKKNGIINKYVLLHLILVLGSVTSVLSKFAAKQSFMSLKFCVFYGSMVFILGIYAILWQQILKHIPLTTAFCNKAVTIIWGMVWGAVIFSETIKWNMIVGAVIVIIGVIIVVNSDADKEQSKLIEVNADE